MLSPFRAGAALLALAALLLGCHTPAPGDLCPPKGGCGSELTCTRNQDFAAGVCTKTCDVGVASTCPSKSLCAPMATDDYCLATCEQDSDCESGAACISMNQSKKVCVRKQVAPMATTPSCAQLVQLNGGQAGPDTDPGTCQRPVVASTLPNDQVTYLGVHHTGEVLTFNVSENTGSFSIVSQGVSTTDAITYQGRAIDNTVVPTQVLDPTGRLVYDDLPNAPRDLSGALAAYGGLSGGTGAFTLPNTSALLDEGISAGSWTFTVNDYASECGQVDGCSGGNQTNTYDVSVVVRPGAPPDPGNLDLAIYWVSEAGITAASATTDSHVQRVLKSFQSYYSAAGICLRTVTHYDVALWAKQKYAAGINADETLPCQDLDQLFALSQPGNQVNLFFVDDLTTGQASSVGHLAGLDGTIPGPSGFSGTIKSGAVMNVSDLAQGTCSTNITPGICGADTIAYIAAHETGHWLGLYHLTESTGDQFDTLRDTPVCRCEACVGKSVVANCGASFSSSTPVVGVNCNRGTQECGGADNLMFWLLDATSRGKLSAEQSEVMRRNPAVQ